MTAYVKKLNLPGMPLRSGAIDELVDIKMNYVKTVISIKSVPPVVLHPYIITDVERFLTPELLDIFRSFDAEPTYFVNFGQTDKLCYTTPVHIDVSAVDENKPIAFAINWELTTVSSLWRWWDTANAPVVSENTMNTLIQRIATPEHSRNLLAGVRYGNLKEFDDQSNAELGFQVIGSQQLLPHTAYMVRTDVPHSITCTNSSPVRTCISLRFRMSDISTWEDAVKRFESLIVE